MSKNRQPSPVGRLLRQWRSVRSQSQLGLALEAGISARHLSFIETGRSRPSRRVVLSLAEILDVPLRERNSMLEAAGYARLYRERSLTDPEMEQLKAVVEFLLDRHQPYPAVALDRHWNIVMANEAFECTTAAMLEASPELAGGPRNVMRMIFHPRGMRSLIVNWEEVGHALINRVQREIAAPEPDPQSAALLDELLSYPGVPNRWAIPDPERVPSVVLPVHMRRDDMELRFFSAITSIGTPQDITVEELRIETFFPADSASDTLMRAMGETG